MQDPTTAPIPLTAVAAGQSGVLARSVDGEVSTRLVELGFVEGTPVKLLRSGALGDPLELELRGYRICLRRRDLAGVRVVSDRT